MAAYPPPSLDSPCSEIPSGLLRALRSLRETPMGLRPTLGGVSSRGPKNGLFLAGHSSHRPRLKYKSSVTMSASAKAIGPDDVPPFEKLMAMLNDCDDVQDVYHNAELPAGNG